MTRTFFFFIFLWASFQTPKEAKIGHTAENNQCGAVHVSGCTSYSLIAGVHIGLDITTQRSSSKLHWKKAELCTLHSLVPDSRIQNKNAVTTAKRCFNWRCIVGQGGTLTKHWRWEKKQFSRSVFLIAHFLQCLKKAGRTKLQCSCTTCFCCKHFLPWKQLACHKQNYL